MKIHLITILLISITFSVAGQNTGFYGKRNYIEMSGTAYVPMISWLLDNGQMYKRSGVGSNLIETKDKLNYGIHFTVGRAGKKNTGFGLEFGYDFANIPGPDAAKSVEYIDQWGYNNNYYIDVEHEMIDVRTLTIMPKLEITKKGATLPLGMVHQIGLGFTSTKILEKDYIYHIIDGSEFMTATDSSNLDNYFMNYDTKYKGFTLMYAFNIRTPVSKSIMINYGIRYSLNLRNFSQNFVGTSKYFYTDDQIKRDIGAMRMSNIITFNLGITLAL